MNKTEIKYTQNFVKSSALIEKLIERSNITDQDHVIEIGTGRGRITQLLAKYAGKVSTVEKDRKLFELSQERFTDTPNVELINRDILEYRFPNNRDYKIFSNIPFNLTSDILRKITKLANPPVTTHLILQEEAAHRYIGKPHTKDSLVSLHLKPFFRMRIVHEFNQNDFEPRPSVLAVLFQMTKLTDPLLPFEQRRDYEDFVTYSLGQWKPTIGETWEKLFSREQLKRLSKDNTFNLKHKPTELGVKQYANVFKYYLIGTTEAKRQMLKKTVGRQKANRSKVNKVNRKRSVTALRDRQSW